MNKQIFSSMIEFNNILNYSEKMQILAKKENP